jgi:hypothetical protein
MPEAFKHSSEKFSSPQEEIEYLRERIKEKERELEPQAERPVEEETISEEVKEYKKKESEEVLTPEFLIKKEEAEAIALDLDPEEHDKQIYELADILRNKGIKNTLTVVDNLKNPHIEDDFHRFLVAYLKEGIPTSGLKEGTPLFRALNMTLYEVLLPEKHKEKGQTPQALKELISSMEQFYAGMLSISDAALGPSHFSLELAIPNVGEEFTFYVSVAKDKQELFEKHILSIFPDAKITEQENDYNIFNEKGFSVGSVAELKNKPIYPLKTYEVFDRDPLNVILNSFSKIDTEGEGAAIQIIFNPAGGETILRKYKHALEQIQKGKPLKEAVDIPTSIAGEVVHTFKEIIRGDPKKKDDPTLEAKKEKERSASEQAIESIKQKTSAPIVFANIRLAASGKTEQEAEAILGDIESAFNQFENTQGNKLKFQRLSGKKLQQMLKNFSFRMFDDGRALPVNLKELTTMMHFHTVALESVPQLRQTKAGSAPAPTGLPSDGVILGVNRHRNAETLVKIGEEDRLRHFYIIGQTGTGKSTLLKNLIVQDIERGAGVCFIDPHGVDILDVLSNIPPERHKDVIYFDPSYTLRPMGLNMLEYDQKYPEQKTFVVNELFSIFQKLYGAVPESMGPMFEQYFRNATMLVIEDPETGSTLLDVSRVMADKSYRDLKLSHCRNPIVVQFWRDIAEKAGGEAALANIVPYITSKFDVFLANDIIRPIVAQQKSAVNFRKIMDERKILLVNLSKGRLGGMNANLIGLIVVGKILMAALSRVDSLGGEVSPFYLFVDEFQNVTTDSISTILSEARKYKLGLIVAHQFIAQLEEDIKDSVFGNVGSMVSFRVGSDDAEYLEKQFAPVFSQNDLMNLDNRNAYLRLLVNGRPVKSFNIEILPPKLGKREIVSELKELSYQKYGRAREEVEKEITKKYGILTQTAEN